MMFGYRYFKVISSFNKRLSDAFIFNDPIRNGYAINILEIVTLQ